MESGAGDNDGSCAMEWPKEAGRLPERGGGATRAVPPRANDRPSFSEISSRATARSCGAALGQHSPRASVEVRERAWFTLRRTVWLKYTHCEFGEQGFEYEVVNRWSLQRTLYLTPFSAHPPICLAVGFLLILVAGLADLLLQRGLLGPVFC